VKRGVIRDYIADIDYSRLGYISALFFVSIRADAEKEFIAHIDSLDHISWAGTHLGRWSMGMAIYGIDTGEVERRFQDILIAFGSRITDHMFEFYKTIRLFPAKYLGGEAKETVVGSEPVRLDVHDMAILKSLSKSARMSSMELARHIPLSPVAIAQRISALEKSGVIRGYSIYLDVFRLGIYLFVFFIRNRRLDQRQKLFTFLEGHPRVTLLLDYIGDPFIEFGIFAKDPYEIRAILHEIKETFPDNEIVDFFLAQEDFISFGTPACVFGSKGGIIGSPEKKT
jgi:DNA-binding Lrp family transcriptional regulator